MYLYIYINIHHSFLSAPSGPHAVLCMTILYLYSEKSFQTQLVGKNQPAYRAVLEVQRGGESLFKKNILSYTLEFSSVINSPCLQCGCGDWQWQEKLIRRCTQQRLGCCHAGIGVVMEYRVLGVFLLHHLLMLLYRRTVELKGLFETKKAHLQVSDSFLMLLV